MRKVLGVFLAVVLLVAPTAIVTASQNWQEISHTLGEIQKTLGSISTLINQGALEGSAELSTEQLLLSSGIPVGLAMAVKELTEDSSGRGSVDSSASLQLTTSTSTSKIDLGVVVDAAFDSDSESGSADVDIQLRADEDFLYALYGEEEALEYGPLDFDFGFSSMTVGRDAFFRITKGGDFVFFDLSKYRNEWMSIEGSEFSGSGAADSSGFNEREIRAFLRAHARYPIFKFTKLSDSRIGGQWYTTYRVDLVPDNLISFEEARMEALGQGYAPMSLEERRKAEGFLKGIKASAVVAFDSQEHVFKSIDAEIVSTANISDLREIDSFDLDGSLNPDLRSYRLYIASKIEFSNHNERVRFDTPSRSIPFQDVFAEVMGVVMTQFFPSENR